MQKVTHFKINMSELVLQTKAAEIVFIMKKKILKRIITAPPE